MDAEGVLAAVIDQVNGQLRTTVVAGTASTNVTEHDANYVWSQVYDQATNSIRVIGV